MKNVYLFSEGNEDMRSLLGGKGANLAGMTNMGLPIPPGFIITTEVCNEYARTGELPAGVWEDIEAAIRRDFHEFGFATCPHTATATHTWRQLDDALKSEHDWILVATAHPAKFETIVEPLIGTSVPLPDGLADILARPSRSFAIDADLAALDAALQEFFSA